jgi:hypothetical protein
MILTFLVQHVVVVLVLVQALVLVVQDKDS